MSIRILKEQVANVLRRKGLTLLIKLLAAVRFEIVTMDIVAGIRIDEDEGCIICSIGSRFGEYSRLDQRYILVHELMHIIQILDFNTEKGNLDYTVVKEKIKDNPKLVEDFETKGPLYDRWLHKCANYGMDAEVNQDIERVFDWHNEQIIYHNTLPKFIRSEDPHPPPDLTFMPYTQWVIDRVVPSEEEEGCSGCNGVPMKLTPRQVRILEGVLKKVIEQAKADKEHVKLSKKAEELLEKMCGQLHLTDVREVVEGLPKDEGQLRKILCALRSVFSNNKSRAYSWGRLNPSYPTKRLPGYRETKFQRIGKKAVVVVDSSSSMGEQELAEGVRIARWFEKQNALAVLYSCDTELTPFKLSKSKTVLEGGGGTEFGRRHVEQIVKEYGQDIDVVYVTDGKLDLSEARAMKTVHLVVVK